MGSSGRRLLAAFVGLSCALLLGTLAAADERLTIGFLDLELGSGAPEGVDRVARELHYQLAATGRFEVIDRGARDSLLQEQAFSLSDCADDDCSLEVGRLLSTKLMINGQLCRDGAVYVATIFAIDVERGTTWSQGRGKGRDLGTAVEGAVTELIARRDRSDEAPPPRGSPTGATASDVAPKSFRPEPAAPSSNALAVEVVARLGYRMALVEPGTFVMGSSISSDGHEDDETPHTVTLTRTYQLGTTEVSQRLWRTVMGTNPAETGSRLWNGSTSGGACSSWGVGSDLPVHCVTWLEAVTFCNRLSKMAGLEASYRVDGTSVRVVEGSRGFRLPTEAEWEYAATSGGRTRFSGTDDEASLCRYANVANPATREAHPWMKWSMFDCDDGYAELAPVGSFKPGAFGLFDLTGNVWEWMQDGYRADYERLPSGDPAAPPTASDRRVLRGGSWHQREIVRSANRFYGHPGDRSWYVGFRVARTPD